MEFLTLLVFASLMMRSAHAEDVCQASVTNSRGSDVTVRVMCQGNITADTVVQALSGSNYPKVNNLVLSGIHIDALDPRIFDFTPGIRSLDLHENMLTSVPKQAFGATLQALWELDLSNNLITALADDSFPYLSLLQSLSIRYNHIRNISTMAFRGLNALTTLKLDHNLLQTLPRGFISQLFRLENLYITNNMLAALGEGVFRSGSLTRLELTMNHIAKLNDNVFSGLGRLRYLYLSNNLIKNVSGLSFAGLHQLAVMDLSSNHMHGFSSQTFRDLEKLDRLSMIRNYLSTLDSGVIRPLARLTRLDISDNPIDSLDSWDIPALVALQRLHLRGTHITRLPDLSALKRLDTLDLDRSRISKVYGCDLRMLPSLSWLRVTSCPLVCDCDMQWLLEWYQQEADEGLLNLVLSTTVCSQSSLPALKGRQLIELDVNDLCPIGEAEGQFCDPLNETSPWHRSDTTVSRDLTTLRPLQMSMPKLSSTSHMSTITLTWSANDVAHNSFSSMQTFINYQRLHRSDFVAVKVNPDRGSYTLGNLSPVTTYNICMSAGSEMRRESSSDTVSRQPLVISCTLASTNRDEFVILFAALVVILPVLALLAVGLVWLCSTKLKRRSQDRRRLISEPPVAFFSNDAAIDNAATGLDGGLPAGATASVVQADALPAKT